MSGTESRRRSSTLAGAATVLFSLALAALALAPRTGAAQAAAVPGALAGTWTLEGGVARGLQIVDAAFAPTIASLPELLQGMARDRVRGEMPPPQRVVVTLTGARLRVSLQGQRAVVIEGALGAAATTSGVASGTRVTPRVEGGWLELRYEGEGSVLRQLYSTEPDGTRMHVDYTVTSSMISTPVRYRLDFARAGS